MFDEDDLLPISALQHLEFCRRRCALIHLDGLWAENAQTAEGRVLHERVHQAGSETVNGVRIARRLRLCSRELGLFGVADSVEFHPLRQAPELVGLVPRPTLQVQGEGSTGVELPGLTGRWQPFPVEYKRGKRKAERSYSVQLCAQALCLEEMLGTEVPAGALYHGQSRRRQAVAFDASLREHTRDLARQLHALIAAGSLPPPEPGPKCKFCSLAEVCVPKLSRSRSARAYLAQNIADILGPVKQ